jgi:hypothetical protein
MKLWWQLVVRREHMKGQPVGPAVTPANKRR